MQQVQDFLEMFPGNFNIICPHFETFHHFWLNGKHPCIYIIFYLLECHYNRGQGKEAGGGRGGGGGGVRRFEIHQLNSDQTL